MFIVALSLYHGFLRYYRQHHVAKLDMRSSMRADTVTAGAVSSRSATALLRSSLTALQKAVDAVEAAVVARLLKRRVAQSTRTEAEKKNEALLKEILKQTLQETLPQALRLLEKLQKELEGRSENELNGAPESAVVEKSSPLFCGYQLIGDSLLLRYAEQILGETCIYERGMRRIGLCVSGQTTRQLLCRVAEGFAPLELKAVVLIGTNDFLQGVPIEDMKCSLENLLQILSRTMRRIVLLTLPPVPKLEEEEGFWFKHTEYNNFLHEMGRTMPKVCVVDTAALFLESSFKSDMDCFEKWYDDQQRRPDRIHLNRTGLLRLRNHLINCQELY